VIERRKKRGGKNRGRKSVLAEARPEPAEPSLEQRLKELGRSVSKLKTPKRESATFAEVAENARSESRFFPSFLDDLFSGTRLLPAGVFPISWFKCVGVVERSDEDSRYYDENTPKSSLRVMLSDDDFDTRLPFSSSGFGWSPCGGGWRKNMHRSDF